MSRTTFVAVLILPVVFVIGCQPPVKDDPRFRAEPTPIEAAKQTGFATPAAAEVDLVEQMAAQRAAYRGALQQLVNYYSACGNAVKLAWARRELDTMIQYKYLMPAESAAVNIKPNQPIQQADKLYNEALALYKAANALVIIRDEIKLRDALNKFNLLISTYPGSDKMDDAAYRAGRIYEHFRDYEIAATYYQRAFQWDELTPYPARFRAAYVLDQHMHMRKEALALYQLALQFESRYIDNAVYAKTRILYLTKSETTRVEQPEKQD